MSAEETAKRIWAAMRKNLEANGITPESERDDKRKAYSGKKKPNAVARSKHPTKPTR
ncbi:MAG: hypothetical protein P8K07_05235 [Candidatus Binatia bacterium]|nr:hypothetical protein [Candidatus Binatia bacterium]